MLPVQFTPYGAHLSRRRGSMMRAMTDSLGWRSQQLPSPPEKDLGLFHRARNGIVLANSHVHGAAGSQLNPCQARRQDDSERQNRGTGLAAGLGRRPHDLEFRVALSIQHLLIYVSLRPPAYRAGAPLPERCVYRDLQHAPDALHRRGPLFCRAQNETAGANFKRRDRCRVV